MILFNSGARHVAWTLLVIAPAMMGQTPFLSPVETAGFARLTPYDSLQAFLGRLEPVPSMALERIAVTRQGRRVVAVRVSNSAEFGSDPAKLRVLLFAQQHGDEPTGKEALTMLLARLASGTMDRVLGSCDLLIVSQMNPDGSEMGQRQTADSVDLNRSHALLIAPETRGLHDLYYRWMPHVTVDIHQYGSYSTSWSDSGFIKMGDVQLGMLTNLNTSPAVRELQHAGIFPFVAGRMKANGYSFHEYVVGSPSDRVRHSTTEINDGRQGFGILGSVSFIQEGRKWSTVEEQLERCVRSQFTAVEALLEYCSSHAPDIRSTVETERTRLAGRTGQPVVVRMEHRAGSGVLEIPVRVLHPGIDTTWRVRPYHGEVHPLTTVAMPSAYVVTRNDSSVIALLLRHHVPVDTVTGRRTVKVSSASIDSIGWQVLEEDSLPRLFVHWTEGARTLAHGDVVVPTAGIRSLLVTILLEPESMWGLAKYDRFSSLRAQKEFPIFRIP